ncbi:MAG TPA: histidine kinase [Candidatus Acidoferrales bacterium]|nr:histidine kinase [Candidatus Acidoferrales bacterium]
MAKRAQSAAPAPVSPLYALLDNVSIAVALVRFKSLRPLEWELVHINSTAASLFGKSGSGLFSGTLSQNIPDRGRSRGESAADWTMGEVYSRVLHRRKVEYLGRVLLARSNAPARYWVGRAVPLDANTVAVIFEDVSEYEQARRKLHAAHDRLQSLASSGIIQWCAEPETMRFTYVPPEAQDVLGYWPERWMGEVGFWPKHLHPDDRKFVTDACSRVTNKRTVEAFDCRVQSANGDYRWFHVVVRSIDEPPAPRFLSGVMVDITERREAEEAASGLSIRLLQAQDDERRRISRELHDGVGQYLSAAKMSLKMLEREDLTAWYDRRQYLSQCDTLLDQAVREIRTVSYLLHPPLLDEVGLGSALRWLCEGFADRSGISVQADLPQTPSRLPTGVETALFRVAQESLTNVHRHSQGKHASIRLRETLGEVVLEIADDGSGIHCGADAKAGNTIVNSGVGLRGMRERLKEHRGRLEVESSSRGTLIRAVVPKPAAGNGRASNGDRSLHASPASEERAADAPKNAQAAGAGRK